MTDMQIEEVDPAEVAPAEGDDPALRPDIDFLMESIREFGQKVPELLARSPEHNGKYKYKTIDGGGRRYCLYQLNWKMSAIILDRLVSESELIELEFAHNAIRQHEPGRDRRQGGTAYRPTAARRKKRPLGRVDNSWVNLRRLGNQLGGILEPFVLVIILS